VLSVVGNVYGTGYIYLTSVKVYFCTDLPLALPTPIPSPTAPYPSHSTPKPSPLP